jgi:hypothetical protein
MSIWADAQKIGEPKNFRPKQRHQVIAPKNSFGKNFSAKKTFLDRFVKGLIVISSIPPTQLIKKTYFISEY